MSVTRLRCSGKPGFSNASAEITAVPTGTSGPCSACDEPAAAMSLPLLSSCAMVLLLKLLQYRLVRLRGDPHSDRHNRPEAEDPDEQSLCDGAERAELE